MANLKLNRDALTKQWRNITVALIIIIIVLVLVGMLVSSHDGNTPKKSSNPVNLTGIVDESFSESNTESAMTDQQIELESLKKQLKKVNETLLTIKQQPSLKSNDIELDTLVSHKVEEVLSKSHPNSVSEDDSFKQAEGRESPVVSDNFLETKRGAPNKTIQIHSMRFTYKSTSTHGKTAMKSTPYVPSGTFVSAVVLGGVDADASVNGQTNNNGVMLFKLLQPGTLPNGSHSDLQGCFVTASAYGDISSERAYIALDKLSCAKPGKPIIDKSVQGWVFFNGKVGIKGVPLMRDNKIMQWAGVSGVMSGVAGAAQYAQSVQSIGVQGASSVVPGNHVAPYAAYGGASKAADVLSNYYVKRAEQYHPVIQVGAGNVVTIVFKDGFYLDAAEEVSQPTPRSKPRSLVSSEESKEDSPDFTVPEEVMAQIDKSRQTKQSP